MKIFKGFIALGLILAFQLSLISLPFDDVLETKKLPQFKNPVGIAYSSQTNLYYITNRGSGEIITVNKNKQLGLFSSKKLFGPNGIVIVKGVAYVTNSYTPQIKGFDLNTGKEVFSQTLPAWYLNGITSKDNHVLFISDTKKKSIFKIDLADKRFSSFVKTPIINPTGIFYHKKKDILLSCTGAKNEFIVKINGSTGAVISQKQMPYTELDGIFVDKLDNIYFSCWSIGKVFKVDFDLKNKPVEVSSGHSGTAGIFVKEKVLVVANFDSNKVDFKNIQ